MYEINVGWYRLFTLLMLFYHICTKRSGNYQSEAVMIQTKSEGIFKILRKIFNVVFYCHALSDMLCLKYANLSSFCICKKMIGKSLVKLL